jgi:hypothetical protein
LTHLPLVHTEEITGLVTWRPVVNGDQCGSRAFAVAVAVAAGAGAVAVPGLGHVPMPVAVGGVAVLAESGIVVEPGRVDLGEAQGRPERLGDPIVNLCMP